jgi:hypothetical protein
VHWGRWGDSFQTILQLKLDPDCVSVCCCDSLAAGSDGTISSAHLCSHVLWQVAFDTQRSAQNDRPRPACHGGNTDCVCICRVLCVPQVDVDMVDSSRSPLTVNQQLLVLLGSPPPGASTAAAAAHSILGGFQGSAGAAALLGGYTGAPAGHAPAPTPAAEASGVAAMPSAQQHRQQQHKQ